MGAAAVAGRDRPRHGCRLLRPLRQVLLTSSIFLKALVDG